MKMRRSKETNLWKSMRSRSERDSEDVRQKRSSSYACLASHNRIEGIVAEANRLEATKGRRTRDAWFGALNPVLRVLSGVTPI